MSETEAHLSSSHRECTPRVVIEVACFEAACAALKAGRELTKPLEALARDDVKFAAITQKIETIDSLDPALLLRLRYLMRVLSRELHAECCESDAIYDHEDGRRDRTPMLYCSERGQRLKAVQTQLAGIHEALETFHDHVRAARAVHLLH